MLISTGAKAMNRLLGVVHMNPEVDTSWWDHTEEDRYGLGGVRTPEQFYELFGINVVDKTTEGHLCLFVGTDGRMHKEFTPFLKSDGMGIDYSNIHFKWIDPEKIVVVASFEEDASEKEAKEEESSSE
jgi:hypothetical protein